MFVIAEAASNPHQNNGYALPFLLANDQCSFLGDTIAKGALILIERR